MDQTTLQAFESRCTADSLPACQAACPLHLDARGFIGHIQSGKWEKARETLEKSLPFPTLMSLLCDHPCEVACRRGEKGESLAIKSLELTCLGLTPSGKAKKRLPAKNQAVAVLGCGLAGLTAAWDLALKGYNIILHHHTEKPWDFLQENARSFLPSFATEEKLATALTEAFSLLETYGVQYQQCSHHHDLARLQEQYEAVFVDIEDLVELTPSGPLNETTGSLGEDFALVFGGRSPSSAMKAHEGRRGAVTITRFLGKSSPLAMREKEGPHHTDLFVDISTVSPLSRHKRATTYEDSQAETLDKLRGNTSHHQKPQTEHSHKQYPSAEPQQAQPDQHLTNQTHHATSGLNAGCPLLTAEEALQEASRCLQCSCLHCVKSCTYLKHYGDIPKHSARKMFVNLGIFTGYRRANQQINSCALCGQCEALCPNDFSMGELCILMRQDMVNQGKMPPSAHDFALRELEWSTAPSATLFWGKSPKEPCSHVFFPGCQLAAARPNQVRFMFRHLRQSVRKAFPKAQNSESLDVGIWLRCCGIPAHFAGRHDLTQGQVDTLQAQWQALGEPKVIAACASCLRFFQDYLPQVPILSLWEILDTKAPLPLFAQPNDSSPPASTHTGTIHDPCSARHNISWQKAVRNLLVQHQVSFEEPQDTAATTACCGYGGLVWNANPNLADHMAKDRAEALLSTPLTSCIMCRDRFVEAGSSSLHLFDILLPPESVLENWLLDNPPTAPITSLFFQKQQGQIPPLFPEVATIAKTAGPGFSLRRIARISLKEAFMTEEYKLTTTTRNNEETGCPSSANLHLVIAPDVLARAEKQHILMQDMKETIQNAEKNGTLFINDRGLHRAYNRQGSITFWVEYRKEDHSYSILDAYYHRMTISKA